MGWCETCEIRHLTGRQQNPLLLDQLSWQFLWIVNVPMTNYVIQSACKLGPFTRFQYSHTLLTVNKLASCHRHSARTMLKILSAVMAPFSIIQLIRATKGTSWKRCCLFSCWWHQLSCAVYL